MTQEEKAKAYDEAIKKAQDAVDKGMISQNFISDIFPQLKESEDEKIRKALINFFDGWGDKTWDNGIKYSEVVAWLEKQKPLDEEKVLIGARKNVALSIMNYLDDNTKGMCLSNMECEDLEDAVVNSNWSKVYDYMKKKLQGEPQDKGEISDGYHTFNELYYYRMLYNAAFFNMLPKEWVHKSKKHHDGEECFGGGWFIVIANLPTGQISNHYELKDWNLFQIPEKEVADKWDGHTPQEAADRLYKYLLEKQGEPEYVGEYNIISISSKNA